jgi:gliding motility-associated lipoprotein GldH
MKPALIFISGLLILLMASCGPEPEFAGTEDLRGEQWAYDEPASFAVDIDDTLAAYDLFIDLRTTKTYPYSNLYIFLEITHQENLLIRDTVELPLAENDGKWTGEVTGTMVDNHILTYQGMAFRKAGTYNISLTQAMREDVLPQVASVGISLYKQN